MTPKVLIILQRETSNPARVGAALERRGYTLDIHRGTLPENHDGYAAAVIFGGPMSANDDEKLPFVRQQLDWIPKIVDAGTPFLGICLGAQLLARALGSPIESHPQGIGEIGYFEVRPTAAGKKYFKDGPFHAYHWNREGFDVPTGAVLIAEGDTFPNQAFRYGEAAFAMQFHPEATRDIVELWSANGAKRPPVPGGQSRETQLRNNALHDASSAAWLEGFLDQWPKPVPPR